MQTNNKRILLLLLLAATLMTGACKKNYTSGGSLSVANTPLSNMDYLSANQYHEFDSTIAIINKLGLATEVNNAKTFFAFTDFSVLLYINQVLTARQNINPSATYTLDSLVKNISADTIRQYMFGQTIELANAQVSSSTSSVTPVPSLGNTTMYAYKQLQTAAPYTNMTLAPTYLLFFGKVTGAPLLTPVLCQTTGIKTSNGNTTLHVLANSHVFARF